MLIELTDSNVTALVVEHICRNIGVQYRDKLDSLKQDIQNCLTSIETAEVMLTGSELSNRDRLAVEELRKRASTELSELIKRVAPKMVT